MVAMKNTRNLGLDIMRSIAIFFVVYIHLVTSIFAADIGVFWYTAYLGVELFFVLSGFLIGNILIDSIETAKGYFDFSYLRLFYIRRLFRTAPLYFILLGINFFIGRSLLKSVDDFDFKYVFWLQNFVQYPNRFFGESWSLSIEEWFYLIFPFGIFLLFKIKFLRDRYIYTLLWYILLFICACNLIRLIKNPPQYQEFNIVIYRLDSIVYGVLVATLDRYLLHDWFEKNRLLCGVSGLLIVILSALLFIKKTLFGEFYLIYYPLVGIGSGLCLIYLKNIGDYLKWVIKYKSFFEKISRLSYSVYLNNMLVIFLVLHYVKLNPLLKFCIAIVCIMGLSWLTYTFIEKGFLKIRDYYFPSPYNKPIQRIKNSDNA